MGNRSPAGLGDCHSGRYGRWFDPLFVYQSAGGLCSRNGTRLFVIFIFSGLLALPHKCAKAPPYFKTREINGEAKPEISSINLTALPKLGHSGFPRFRRCGTAATAFGMMVLLLVIHVLVVPPMAALPEPTQTVLPVVTPAENAWTEYRKAQRKLKRGRNSVLVLSR